MGELAVMNSRLGRKSHLERILDEVKDRDVSGPAVSLLEGARQGLWSMNNMPGRSFLCGPMALDRVRVARGLRPFDPKILAMKSTLDGTSLSQVFELSESLGMGMRTAHREAGAELLLPAVIHWKVGHFAALVRKEGDRYLAQDPTFGDEYWVSQATIDAEASG